MPPPGGAPGERGPGRPDGRDPRGFDPRRPDAGRPGGPPDDRFGRPGPRADEDIRREDERDRGLRGLDDLRGGRRESREGGRVIIREPGGRIIIQEGGRSIIRRDEAGRFRRDSRDVRTERRGQETVTITGEAGGYQVLTYVDADGRLVRRSRRGPDGREVIIIDNRSRGGGPRGPAGYFVDLPPPVIRIPRDRYILEAEGAPYEVLYDTLLAPPVERPLRRYTLDEIRYSPEVRARMSRVDIDTITFDTGSWELTPDGAQRLSLLARALKQAIAANPQEVFLIEGHTDAVGSAEDNLSLSDRRAESVAVALQDMFQVPPENLTTQGYGEQQLKVNTQAAERQNRRVTVRRITPLLTGAGGPPPRR